MLWYYAAGGEQRGPVSQDELQNLVSAGTVQAGTLVWKDGMSAWEPLERVAQTAGIVLPSTAPIPPAPSLSSESAPQTPLPDGIVVCAECGQQFPLGDTVQFEQRHVCAQCKPRLIQRLSEGASLPPSSDGKISEQALLSKDYSFDFSEPFSNSANALKREPLILIAAPILTIGGMILLACISIVPMVGAYIQMLAQAILYGPLMAGIIRICLATTRGQPVDFSTIFYGFGPRFVQLAIVQGIPQLIGAAALLPLTLLGVSQNQRAFGMGAPVNITDQIGMVSGIWLILGVFLVAYLSVCWMYALFLVVDKNYDAVDALKLSFKVVQKHWWRNFSAYFLYVFFSFVGLAACCIGILVSIPFGTCMYTSFYRQIFDPLEPKANRI